MALRTAVLVALVATCAPACGDEPTRVDGSTDRGGAATIHAELVADGVPLSLVTSGSSIRLDPIGGPSRRPVVEVDLGRSIANAQVGVRPGRVDLVATTCERVHVVTEADELAEPCDEPGSIEHVEVATDGWKVLERRTIGSPDEVLVSVGAAGRDPVVTTASTTTGASAVWVLDEGEWRARSIPVGPPPMGGWCATAMGLVGAPGSAVLTTTTPPAVPEHRSAAVWVLAPGATAWQTLDVATDATGGVDAVVCAADAFFAAIGGADARIVRVTGAVDGAEVEPVPVDGARLASGDRQLDDHQVLAVRGPDPTAPGHLVDPEDGTVFDLADAPSGGDGSSLLDPCWRIGGDVVRIGRDGLVPFPDAAARR